MQFEYIPPTIRGINPVRQEVAIWMRTGRALHGTLSWMGSLNANRIVSTARSFEELEMAPQADGGKKLLITLLH